MTKDRSGCRPLISYSFVINLCLRYRTKLEAIQKTRCGVAKNLFSIRLIYRTGMYKVNTEATEASARLVTGARRLAGALSKCRLSVVEMR